VNSERDEFGSDWVSVDGAQVSSVVIDVRVTDLQVPLAHLPSLNTKPRVVNHSTILVCQRHGLRVQPRHLPTQQTASTALQLDVGCSCTHDWRGLSVCMCVCVLVATTAEPIEMALEGQTRWPNEPHIRWGTYKRHLGNTTE